MENKKMTIKSKIVKIKDLIEGFEKRSDDSLWAFGGKLNIRPAYQREFRYSEGKQKAVIDTVLKQRPLNVMYWAKNTNPETGEVTWEVIDGQQRILSIINFAEGEFSVNDENGNPKTYTGVTGESLRKDFEDYELQVYECEGDETEKLEWFSTINIAAEVLTKQELLNATYHGPFISACRKFFAPKGMAERKYKMDLFLNGSTLKQEWLEKTLEWISKGKEDTTVQDYLAKHRLDDGEAFKAEIAKISTWVCDTFMQDDVDYHKSMRGVSWGDLYYANLKNQNYGSESYEKFKAKVLELLRDSDVTKKSGIYAYCLDGNESHLSIRSFTDNDKSAKWLEQDKLCANGDRCKLPLEGAEYVKGDQLPLELMEGDHITPWSLGGKTTPANLQMLCKSCNRDKSNN